MSVLSGVHRASNFDQAGSSGLYDRARPSYPLELVDRIFNAINKPDIDVLEHGAGTGIFTRLLLGRTEVKSLLALEPSEGMRAGFKQSVIDQLPVDFPIKVDVQPGTFTHSNERDSSKDLIVIAQAFHWIGSGKSAHEAAMAEFARVLKPGGVLALIWNLEQWQQPGWSNRVHKLVEVPELASGSPQYRLGLWKPIFETSAYKENYTSPFEPGKGHDVHTVYRGEPVTVQGFIDRLNSKSYIAALSEDDRTELENNIRTIVEDEKDKSVKWVDREQGVLEQPFQTDLYLFKRV